MYSRMFTCLVLWALMVLMMLMTVSAADIEQYDMYESDADSDRHLFKFPEQGELPFVVWLSSKAGLCTGSLLSDHWVLTAANCVYDNRNKKLKDQAVQVVAALLDYGQQGTSPYEQTRSSVEIRVHPGFAVNRVAKFNVALIKVRDPFELGQQVGIVKVSGRGWPQKHGQVQNCTAVGYGSYYTTSVESTTLRYWKVRVEHGERACPCLKRFQWKRLLCVRDKSYPMLAKVDSGGPLLCGGDVVAVAHMVWDRNACEDPVYPLDRGRGDTSKDNQIRKALSSFYYLCPINDWLHGIVPQVPKKPKSCRAHALSHTLTFLYAALLTAYVNYC